MNQYSPYATVGGTNEGVGFAASKPHSGIGIASFVIACLGGLAMLGLIVMAGVMETSSPGGMDEDSASAVLLGLSMIGIAFGLVLSAILGIVSLFQTTRKKLFGILGLSISVVIEALFLSILVIGLMMG